MHQMRAVTLSGYLEVARSVGLDGQRLLREAAITPEVLSDPELRLPASAVIGLLDRSAALSGCEAFGVLMAEARSFSSLGPGSLLLERLPDVRVGILAAIDSSHAVAHALKLARELPRDALVLCNLSGRGDKDIFTIAKREGIEL